MRRVIRHPEHDGGMPAVDVTRYRETGKGITPIRLRREQSGIDSRQGTTEHLGAPVVPFESGAQCRFADVLKLRLQRGPDDQAPGKELVLSEPPRQLPPDLVGEEPPRRPGRPDRGDVAALNRYQRLAPRGLRRFVREMSVLGHFLEDEVAPGDGAFVLPYRMVVARRLGQRRQIRRFRRSQIFQAFREIRLSGSGDAVGILAEKDLVQIEFEDLFLVQRVLEPRRQDQLLDLALRGPLVRQQEVLHHLLRDRRRAAQAPPLQRLHRGLCHADGVVPLVGVEILVLGADERVLHESRDFVDGRVDSPLAREFVYDVALDRIDARNRRGFVGRKLLVVGKSLAVQPEHRTQAEGRGKDARRQQAEQRPEQ